MRLQLAVIVMALCFSGGMTTGARTAPQAASRTDYRALVDSYRSNGAAEIDRVLTTPREELDRAADAAGSPTSPWDWQEVRAAAMLHSEAAVRALRALDPGAAGFQITLAQRLLNHVVSRSRTQEDFAWRWYTVVPRLLGSLGESSVRKRLEAYAAIRWGYDVARGKYVRGLGFESTGAREGQAILRPGASGAFTTTERQASWFVPAAAAFADALKENPHWRAAAVHLGRIRMLQGQRDEAATLFRSALEDADPSVAYLAALFLASLEERAERFASAETLYRNAVARIPYGQSAPLALAELLSRTGRDAEARDTLAARLLKPGAAVSEPLWTFASAPDQEVGTRFDLLRMEVWK